ncbi:MAG: LysM domain-containing protein, partial [Myxococcota bacterium]
MRRPSVPALLAAAAATLAPIAAPAEDAELGIKENIQLRSSDSSADADQSLIEWGGARREETVGVLPQAHEVKKGDTLWDICATIFGSAWEWPRIWSYNPQITNPHWIYPGDRLSLMPPAGAPPVGDEPTAAAGAAPTAPLATGETGIERVGRRLQSDLLFLRQTAFVEESELRQAGTIAGAKEIKQLLVAPDEVYVSFDGGAAIRPGDRYAVYRPVERVKAASKGRYLGWLVEIVATLEVREIVSKGPVRAALIDTTSPAERGMRVGPLRRQLHETAPRRNDKELQGMIATSLPRTVMIGSDAIVVIDRGEKDGVQAGNRFFVVRSGENLDEPLPENPSAFPREVIAEILVLEPHKRTS